MATAWTVGKETELRFEVSAEASVTLVLKLGTAEIFGTELVLNREYSFTDCKAAVFTWYGCKLETTGDMSVAYVSDETPMISCMNIHAQLESRREEAAARGEGGPRVLVAGPADAGKSSLVRILSSYAVRLGRKPLFVELDVTQGGITVPGTISATQLDRSTVDVEDGLVSTAPLTYWYGHTDLKRNPDLYKMLVGKLAKGLNQKFEQDPEARYGGMIVNTCGWVSELGYELLQHAIAALEIDTILVLGHDRLHAQLAGSLGQDGSGRTVIKLARSGGVVERDDNYRRQRRMQQIKEYFYGSPGGGQNKKALNPHLTEVAFADLNVWKISDSSVTNSAALPVGHKSMLAAVRLIPVMPTSELNHSLLSVCHPPVLDENSKSKGDVQHSLSTPERQRLLEQNCAGFVYVSKVDVEAQVLTLLAPCPGPLPSLHFFQGSLIWIES